MSASATLLRGRKRAEADMIDAGELRGPDTDGPIDPDTGEYTKIPGALKYSGKAKAQTAEALGNEADAGDRLSMVTRFEVHLPVSAPQAAVDDVFTFTSSVHDPQLVGKRFRVASLIQKSFLTARRLAVEEVQS